MAFQVILQLLLVLIDIVCGTSNARAERLGDLSDVVGARDNQLIGYGVVTGLNGTGDDLRSRIASQTLRSMLRRMGVQVEDRRMRLRNIAAVMVTTTIAPFARNGSNIDVTVSSIGNARSLAGGVLLQTTLRGADRMTYAVAQGSLVVGGYSASGRTGTSYQSNSTTTARIPGGAIVEREIPTSVIQGGEDTDKDGKPEGEQAPGAKGEGKKAKTITYSLRTSNFVTAQRIAAAINDSLGSELATALDGGAVKVNLPKEFEENPIPMLARLAELEVVPYQPAKVVINERTGTVVVAGDVRLSPVAIAQGGISVSIYEQTEFSQPNPFTFRGGESLSAPRTDVTTEEKKSRLRFLDGASTLSDVSTALAALGVTPRELSSVMQALREAGALRAKVVIQ